jgi:hypothetical protein
MVFQFRNNNVSLMAMGNYGDVLSYTGRTAYYQEEWSARAGLEIRFSTGSRISKKPLKTLDWID